MKRTYHDTHEGPFETRQQARDFQDADDPADSTPNGCDPLDDADESDAPPRMPE
jgi:hypothetical protein